MQQLITGEFTQIDFPEPTYSVNTALMREFDTHILRFRYSSLTTPLSVYDYNMDTPRART